MNQYISLTKTFISAIGMSKPQDKRRKCMIAILTIFAFFGILLPVAVFFGVLVKLMTETLTVYGCASRGVTLLFHVICLFTVIFGINVIFNEFYFSNDIEYLLPWPLRAYQIIASKFTATYINENFMQIILVISCVVGYGIGAKMGVANWLLSIVGIITLPILPLAYCGIISILVMGVTRFIRNKDILQNVTTIIIILLFVIFVGSIGFLQNMDIDRYAKALAGDEPEYLTIMNYVFPNVALFVKTFSEGSIKALFGYSLINIVAVVVMLFVAEQFYFKGVIELTSEGNSGKQKDLEKMLARCKQHSPAYAYFLKEVRILIRTQVYFVNCIMIEFLWPLFVYAMYKVQSKKLTLEILRELYAKRDLRIQLFFLLGIVGISVIISAMNSICSNSISREGKFFSFMKYIPVSVTTQWNVKTFVGIFFSAVSVLIYVIPFCILVKVPFIHILTFVLLSMLSICFISYLGIYLDSIQPKLIWDDEMSSLRENYNNFFAMAMAIAFVLIFCVGGFFVFCNTKLTIGLTAILFIIILAAANLIVLGLTAKSGVRNIEEQEEA